MHRHQYLLGMCRFVLALMVPTVLSAIPLACLSRAGVGSIRTGGVRSNYLFLPSITRSMKITFSCWLNVSVFGVGNRTYQRIA